MIPILCGISLNVKLVTVPPAEVQNLWILRSPDTPHPPPTPTSPVNWPQKVAWQCRCSGVYLSSLWRPLWSWMEYSAILWNRRHPRDIMRGSRVFRIRLCQRCFLSRTWNIAGQCHAVKPTKDYTYKTSPAYKNCRFQIPRGVSPMWLQLYMPIHVMTTCVWGWFLGWSLYNVQLVSLKKHKYM